jgi:hypothetical protein
MNAMNGFLKNIGAITLDDGREVALKAPVPLVAVSPERPAADVLVMSKASDAMVPRMLHTMHTYLMSGSSDKSVFQVLEDAHGMRKLNDCYQESMKVGFTVLRLILNGTAGEPHIASNGDRVGESYLSMQFEDFSTLSQQEFDGFIKGNRLNGLLDLLDVYPEIDDNGLLTALWFLDA